MAINKKDFSKGDICIKYITILTRYLSVYISYDANGLMVKFQAEESEL